MQRSEVSGAVRLL